MLPALHGHGDPPEAQADRAKESLEWPAKNCDDLLKEELLRVNRMQTVRTALVSSTEECQLQLNINSQSHSDIL